MDTPSDAELVTVFRTSDSALLPVIRSVLDAASIPYVVQGEQGMGLFPRGTAGGGMFRRVLGASILVSADRADEARELLQEHGSSDEPES